MAMHPFWKGYLKLSQVACPVSMVPVVADRSILYFGNFANEEEGELAAQVIEAMIPRNLHTIDLRVFAPAAAAERLRTDAPIFLVPDDWVGMDGYQVIRDVMQGAGVVGISQMSLYQRCHPVVVEARESSIVIWPLRDYEATPELDEALPDMPSSSPDPRLKAKLDRLLADHLRRWSPEKTLTAVEGRLDPPAGGGGAEVIHLDEARRHRLLKV